VTGCEKKKIGGILPRQRRRWVVREFDPEREKKEGVYYCNSEGKEERRTVREEVEEVIALASTRR